MPRREIQPQRRANLDQHREEQHQPALDPRRLQSENVRQHSGLIVSFAPGPLLFEPSGLALQSGDAFFVAARFARERRFRFQFEIAFAERARRIGGRVARILSTVASGDPA